jgi:hypothetical protein
MTLITVCLVCLGVIIGWVLRGLTIKKDKP